mmetsp:Transcript_124423/g.346387  ORF Transcript_124423/g.346387 Transcript_124423/m.346387 type:complete len:289 (+) Transcript_124423:43-909(+)
MGIPFRPGRLPLLTSAPPSKGRPLTPFPPERVHQHVGPLRWRWRGGRELSRVWNELQEHRLHVLQQLIDLPVRVLHHEVEQRRFEVRYLGLLPDEGLVDNAATICGPERDLHEVIHLEALDLIVQPCDQLPAIAGAPGADVDVLAAFALAVLGQAARRHDIARRVVRADGVHVNRRGDAGIAHERHVLFPEQLVLVALIEDGPFREVAHRQNRGAVRDRPHAHRLPSSLVWLEGIDGPHVLAILIVQVVIWRRRPIDDLHVRNAVKHLVGVALRANERVETTVGDLVP